MLDGCEQCADRMASGGVAQIFGSDMQIDLRARDLAMTQEVTNRDESDPGAHEMCREGVSQAMWESGMPTRLRWPQVRTRS